MLESIVGQLEKAEGIAQVEDFGSVHSGRLGYADCETRLALETWKNVYFVRVTVIQTKGRGMKKTRVVKWPYSKDSPKALGAVVEDLDTFVNGLTNGCLHDNRTAFGRFFDALTRTDHLGRYEFLSPIGEPFEIKVTGQIVRYGEHIEATLTERRP
ncbi:MAG: hypothetical protein KAH44_07820, partial [Oricola sp.]|nr:hypothetical protein [Oricola sp.]